jgi:hypothetical protein
MGGYIGLEFLVGLRGYCMVRPELWGGGFQASVEGSVRVWGQVPRGSERSKLGKQRGKDYT